MASRSRDPPCAVHFVFLVHGFMGHPDELSYYEDAIKEAATMTSNEKEEGDDDDNNSNSNSTNSKEDADDDYTNNVVDIVTHRVTCNGKRTFDGIEAGGKRVAREVRSFVRSYCKKRNGGADDDERDDREAFRAGVSFVGYSLGGMYARYAVSVLPLKFDDDDDDDGIGSGSSSSSIELLPFSFVTAATPHLGMASHTYVTAPRVAEYIVGYGFGRTGRDLFRLHANRGSNKKKKGKGANGDSATTTTPGDLIYRMATEDEFLDPLSAYRRRVSYVNAFASDVMVPAATAGMLSRHSDVPQYYLSSEYDHRNPETMGGFDVHVFRTRPCGRPEGKTRLLQSSGTGSRRNNDEAATMSISLDSLGWTKVFVDARSGMPGPSIRCVCRRPRKDLMNDAVSEKKEAVLLLVSSSSKGDAGGRVVDGSADVVFRSWELRGLMKNSENWHPFPSGHFVLVAHSKTERGARKSAKGRPCVDRAASDLVKSLKGFQKESRWDGVMCCDCESNSGAYTRWTLG